MNFNGKCNLTIIVEALICFDYQHAPALIFFEQIRNAKNSEEIEAEVDLDKLSSFESITSDAHVVVVFAVFFFKRHTQQRTII